MADRRSRPRAATHQQQHEGPQRLAEVLTEVLTRYGYDVRPQSGERPSNSAAVAAPTRQLGLFSETGLGATA